MLAAASVSRTMNGVAKRTQFSDSCRRYAENNGLIDTLDGQYQFPVRGGLQGIHYTKLTKLATHDEVDACNAIVNDLFTYQLGGYSPVVIRQLTKVIGELHDNVASHANGAGFSCAQVYRDPAGQRIEFAVADAGCGMLENVSRKTPAIVDDRSAIRWCLQKGNTTAITTGDWAQRLPDDAVCNPYPEGIETFATEDHHLGEGLWQLAELVRGSSGSLAVLSGTGEYFVAEGKESVKKSALAWPGVVIEFEITVPLDAGEAQLQSDRLEEIAKRIGI